MGSRDSWMDMAARSPWPRCSRAVNQKVLPLPGRLLAPASPPISVASLRVMARPSPVPPALRVLDRSACSKAPNSRGITSGAMPMPVSSTSKRSHTDAADSCCTRQRNVTLPRSVNLIALATKLVRIWRTRSGSPRTAAGTSSATESTKARPLASASGR